MTNSIKYTLLLLLALISGACANQSTNTAVNTAPPKPAASTDEKAAKNSAPPANTEKETPKAPDKSACLSAKMEGKRLIASQTFVFDHEPFTGSCFVTFASKEDMLDEKDVPRGSTFHIFKDGKKVFDFPDAFAGISACWIEAVGFEDLNGDKKTDVVVAGKCLSARDAYPQNAVFANTGSKFTTNADANDLLNELKTVKSIEDFVKKNQSEFF